MATSETILTALIKLVGLRQIDAARELGVSRSTLAGWLAGYSPMPDDVIVKIHRFVADRLNQIHQAR